LQLAANNLQLTAYSFNMQEIIFPSRLSGVITAPASKSSMQRACAAALLSTGTSILINPGHSNDDLAATDVIQKLGAVAEALPDGRLQITSSGVQPVSDELHCGESGLGIRMFTPIAALSDQRLTITGSGSLQTRPMDFFDAVLPQLGVSVQSNMGKLPMTIQGPLRPAAIEVDGSLSSQFLTGLLMAYGAAGGGSIRVHNLKSKPYIDLTMEVMQAFGVKVKHEAYEWFTVSGGGFQPQTYTVEGDWSGAAFLLAAGAVAGDIVVKGLDVFSTQADRAILQALAQCGASLSVQTDQIRIGPAALQAFHFNATDCPDLFPPLAALAAYCEGTSVIEGVSRLAHKESNRGLTLQEELGKLGVDISLQDDLMIIRGGKPVQGGVVHSRHDHRIAMACAVAALGAQSPVRIEDAEAVGKSYPDFFEDIKQLTAG
jgi:3-phosphoshikimate 1-carboxyvinyltransferase